MLGVARVVDALGWEGASAVLDEAWDGWEADVLAEGLPIVLASWKGAERASDRRWWARVLGGR